MPADHSSAGSLSAPFCFSWRGEGTINLSTGRLRQLTTRERTFLKHLFVDRMTQVDAYLEAVKRPDGTSTCSHATAHVSASKMMARMRRNPALFADILKAVEIDDYTLAGDLHRMRVAKKTEFYQGMEVATVEDNGTQMRAVELIADILGHRKAGSALDLSGSLTIRYDAEVDNGFTKPNPEA